jgi:hypothetical protein
MNLSAKEIEILKVLQSEYPKPSSVKKLVEATKRDRSVIKNVLVGLKTLRLLSVTDKYEVSLLKAGKEYLGIDYPDIKPFFRESISHKEPSPVTSVTAIKLATTSPGKDKSTSIDISLDNLESKLKHEPLTIEAMGLKLSVLKRLSLMLAPDIGEVLLSISDDLTGVDSSKGAA